MKVLLFAFGLMALIYSDNAQATAQAPEKLIIEGKTYSLYSNPLASYWSDQNPRPKFDPSHTGLYRGYVATWEIDNGIFYLKKINAKINGAAVGIDQLFSGNSGRVEAKWFAGELRVQQGETMLSGPRGSDSISERELIITIKAGKVIKQAIKDNTDIIQKTFEEYPGLLEARFSRRESSQWDSESKEREGDYYTTNANKVILTDVHFLDKTGKVVIKIPAGYLPEPFADGFAKVVNDTGKQGYIDKTGKTVIECRFTLARPFSEGLALVSLGEGMGYINKIGTTIIPGPFKDGRGFSESLAAVLVDQKWGYIDNRGKMIIPPQFDAAQDFSEGLATVKIGEIYKMIDNNGKLVHQFSCGAEIGKLSEGLALAGVMGDHGYIDKTGKIVIEPEILEGKPWLGKAHRESFSEGLAASDTIVDFSRKYGYLDKTGAMVIKPQFEGHRRFSQGLAAVELERKWGYIDKTGQVVIPLKFDRAYDFNEDRAVVKLDRRKWAVIDPTGKVVFEPPFNFVNTRFSEGLLRVGNLRYEGSKSDGRLESTEDRGLKFKFTKPGKEN